jgi:hypothetical protein
MNNSSRATAKGDWFKKRLRGLHERDCKFTSKSTYDYNCIGLATGDYLWWHPVEQDEHYWPANAPRNLLVTSYIKALETAHFEISPVQNPSPEPGYEKIVIYGFGKEFRHVALIADSETWKSKLGEFEDVEHSPRPQKLGKYGFVVKYLRRRLEYAGQPLPDEYKI